MLIVALVLAVIGLAALVFAVVTSNALVAWVCIGASLLGVLLLIVDALRERRGESRPAKDDETAEAPVISDVVDDVDSAAEDTDVEDAAGPDAAEVTAGEDQDGG